MLFEIGQASLPAERSEACARITAALPDWFGLEDSNRRYIADAARFEALAARAPSGLIVGLLVYKEVPASAQLQASLDIHWLGILPEYHRRGLGARLIGMLVQIAKGRGFTLLTVETLDPRVADPNYLGTYAFYEELGFRFSRRFNFGSGDPAVQMVRSL